MRVLSIGALATLCVAAASADILQAVPMQGAYPVDPVADMVHAYVVFKDQPAGTFSITTDPATPQLTPLSLSNPADTFDPADPWYSLLDPAGEGRPFSRRYGFLVDLANSDVLPAGTSLGIRLLSADPGLEAHFYRGTSGAEAFDPVFGFGGSQDHVLWNGTMWHPTFSATAPGSYHAEFELFLSSTPGVGAVDYTTEGTPAPGYSVGTVTLSFTAVPEPASAVLLLLGAGLLARRWCRRAGAA